MVSNLKTALKEIDVVSDLLAAHAQAFDRMDMKGTARTCLKALHSAEAVAWFLIGLEQEEGIPLEATTLPPCWIFRRNWGL